MTCSRGKMPRAPSYLTMHEFRTVEVSDPRFERDHLRVFTVKSSGLKGRADVCVFIPPSITTAGSMPVVILLHGVYGSSWSWPLKSGVHVQLMEKIRSGELPPMVLAMPSDGLWGDGSGYLAHQGLHFDKWIAEELPQLLYQYVPGVDRQSPFFISGLSMGGFGALQLGVRYSHLFKAISAHSSLTRLEQMKLFVVEDLSLYQQEERWKESIYETIIRNREKLPVIRFDCGREDQLIEANRELHHQLMEEGIEHVFEEFDGGHEWPYWENHVMDSLIYFSKQI